MYVDFTSNKDIKYATVYARFEGAKEFVEIGEVEGLVGSVGTISYTDKMDIIIVGQDAFGETAESGVVSFGRGAEGEVWYSDFDADADGIEDGIELFYTKTNPEEQDSDGDGFSDKMEVFYLYTDPNVYTEDKDFDNDGLSNTEEISLGTLVYLEDTDFDGKKDGIDAEPLKRNGSTLNVISKIQVGKYDKVLSGMDTDGNLIQYVYDFLNDRMKIEMQEQAVINYHYNYDGNVCARIAKIEDSYLINTYIYDNDKLMFLSNNNYHYGFQYDEKRNITQITLDDKLLIGYNYLEDGSMETTYGNGYFKNEIKSDNQVVAYDNEGVLYTIRGEGSTEIHEFADSGLRLEYTYDETGELTGIQSSLDFAIQYKETEGSDRITE